MPQLSFTNRIFLWKKQKGIKSMKKLDLGQFNTKKDVWLQPQVEEFLKLSTYKKGLDPFAGKGDLIRVMYALDFKPIIGLDIDPVLGWQVNNSLVDIPYYEDTIVVTNPPYYAKVTARRKNASILNYFDGENDKFADIYQIAIANVLQKYDEAVFIIPETYFLKSSMFFKDSLLSITVLEDNPFYDTDCPICVACFMKGSRLGYPSYDIYKNDKFLFTNTKLDEILSRYRTRKEILNVKFNVPDGNIGLRGVDGVETTDKIKFCLPNELDYDINTIKISSRAITVLDVSRNDGKILDKGELIEKANNYLTNFRKDTHDVILAPFKNNNKNGERRRRLDFRWAKKILNKALV